MNGRSIWVGWNKIGVGDNCSVWYGDEGIIELDEVRCLLYLYMYGWKLKNGENWLVGLNYIDMVMSGKIWNGIFKSVNYIVVLIL